MNAPIGPQDNDEINCLTCAFRTLYLRKEKEVMKAMAQEFLKRFDNKEFRNREDFRKWIIKEFIK